MNGRLAKQSGHFAGFDGLRLVGAMSVIFSHAFLIATGSEETETFKRLGSKNIIGLYGVFTFFVISGFLLARSLRADPSAVKYAVNRVLRILPAFAVCIVTSALLIGPFFSALAPGAYYSNAETFGYIRWALDSFSDMSLPGVFNYVGDVSYVVNGSLWSLRYEALSYVLLLALWTVLRSSGWVASAIVSLALLPLFYPRAEAGMAGIAYTLPYFAGGVLMNWVYTKFGSHRLGVLICIVALSIAAYFRQGAISFALFGAYIVVFLGERPNFLSRLTSRIGDCSYGLYLYGWPVEQGVKQVTHTSNPWVLMGISFPLTFLLAYISCHAIEQPAMRFRHTAGGFLRRRAQAAITAFGDSGPAAVWGANATFVVGATLILHSQKQWWFFLTSMGELLAASFAGFLLAAGIHRALRMTGLIRSSSPQPEKVLSAD